jgi:GNAT superfamily N-acetyltransferase
MRVFDEADAASLMAEAHTLFAEREVENNLLLGILQAISRGLYLDPPPWLWSIREGSRLCGVVAEMFAAFEREAVPHEAGKRDVLALAELMIGKQAAFFWDDEGHSVAFAGFNRRLGRGVSIAPVYTPPAWRGRGYASALVAALSQHLLDSGCDYTCLFTDLANPISNSIYPKVGYRPVADAQHVQVRPARATQVQ